MSRKMRRVVAATAAALAAAGVLTVVPASAYTPDGGTATAPANSCGSACLIDHSVGQVDITVSAFNLARTPNQNTVGGWAIKSGSVPLEDLTAAAQAKINSTEGHVSKVESDGPYPGATDLGDLPDQGDNSDDLVPNDGHVHTVWVQCAPGKVAMGGGFRVAADAGEAAAKAVQVTASEPTQVKDGAVVYEPIEGDAAGSFQANGWLVDAINTGTAAVVVRPWVTCLKVG